MANCSWISGGGKSVDGEDDEDSRPATRMGATEVGAALVDDDEVVTAAHGTTRRRQRQSTSEMTRQLLAADLEGPDKAWGQKETICDGERWWRSAAAMTGGPDRSDG